MDISSPISAGSHKHSRIYHLDTLMANCFMSFNATFVETNIMSSSDSTTLCSVTVCSNIVATAVNVSLTDELFALGAC
jgi:hypothetical protein